MSMFLLDPNKEFISFSNFILSESISFKNKQIDFGINSDLNDKKWFNINFKLFYTFTKINDKFYCIKIVKNGEIAFGTSDTFDPSLSHDISYLDKIFSDDRHQTKNILKVFGHLIWILIEGIQQYNFTKFYFKGANPALGTVYEVMLKNKYLIKELNDIGFQLSSVDNGMFVFEKVDMIENCSIDNYKRMVYNKKELKEEARRSFFSIEVMI